MPIKVIKPYNTKEYQEVLFRKKMNVKTREVKGISRKRWGKNLKVLKLVEPKQVKEKVKRSRKEYIPQTQPTPIYRKKKIRKSFSINKLSNLLLSKYELPEARIRQQTIRNISYN